MNNRIYCPKIFQKEIEKLLRKIEIEERKNKINKLLYGKVSK